MNFRSTKGFTLIELLVVIAIIGLISSVVLTSVQSARIKARDASIKKSVMELRNMIEIARNEDSTYANVQSSHYMNNLAADHGIPDRWLCSEVPATFPSASASEQAQIQNTCLDISSKLPTSLGGYALRICTTTGTASNYSIMAQLASGPVLCLGSSGRTSTMTGWFTGQTGNPGCLTNP